MKARVYEIDPLTDKRWATFLERHPESSIFHTSAWLQALRRTYGYQAGALTTSGPDELLANAWLFCRVESWLTGRRLVALPFSDHCAALVDSEETFRSLLSGLKEQRAAGNQKYLEIRPTSVESVPEGLGQSASYCLHRLDLRPALGDIFRSFHDSCIRRKISKADQAGLTYREGRSEELLQQYYRLALMTRRRHLVPPQPISWFRNLMEFIGEGAKIRIASVDGRPAAAILTLRYKHAMTYKYGCSNASFHKLGAMQLLFWKAIQEAKSGGMTEFDMGRSDWDNPGLLAFKDRWGSTRSTLTYYRDPAPEIKRAGESIARRIAKRMIQSVPDRVLATVGGFLYRHAG